VVPTGAWYVTLHIRICEEKCTLKLDEEKSTYAGLAEENGFSPHILLSLLKAGEKLSKAQQSCELDRQECNKYDPHIQV
jgi:hypothetical protein